MKYQVFTLYYFKFIYLKFFMYILKKKTELLNTVKKKKKCFLSTNYKNIDLNVMKCNDICKLMSSLAIFSLNFALKSSNIQPLKYF